MARRYNGTSDASLVNATGLLSSAGTASMFVRFGCRAAGTPQTLVRLGETSGAPFVGMGISLVSGKVNGYHSTNNALNNLVGTSSHPTDGTWWTAAMTCDVAGSHVLYVNGASEITGSQSGGTQVNRTGNTDLMMGYSKNFGERFTGDLAEAAYWSVVLTAAEVSALHNGFPPFLVRPSALVYYGPLIGDASPERDLIGRNELTLTGTTAAAHPRTLLAPWRLVEVPAAGGASAVSREWQLSYDLSAPVAREWQLSYDLIAPVSQEWQLSYDLIAPVSREWQLSYDLIAAVSQSWDISYDLAASVAREWVVYYDLGDVTQSAIAEWIMTGRGVWQPDVYTAGRRSR